MSKDDKLGWLFLVVAVVVGAFLGSKAVDKMAEAWTGKGKK